MVLFSTGWRSVTTAICWTVTAAPRNALRRQASAVMVRTNHSSAEITSHHTVYSLLTTSLNTFRKTHIKTTTSASVLHV